MVFRITNFINPFFSILITFLFSLVLPFSCFSEMKPLDEDYYCDFSQGKLLSYTFSSKLLNNSRDLWVYTPPTYTTIGNPYPLLIIFDGEAYTSDLIPTPTILDHLIGEKLIPPLVAVFVSSIDQKHRNLELPCYHPFIQSLNEELLPWIYNDFHVTNDPAHTIVCGSSYGGLAAAYAALTYPERFGNVLSQSGAFWWHPLKRSKGWLIDQYKKQEPLQIRFYLEVGDQEVKDMIQQNRVFYELLQKKGYKVSYQEFEGDHDYGCWRKTLGPGLMRLMRQTDVGD